MANNPTTEVMNKANGAAKEFKQQAEGTLDRFSHDAGERIGSLASRIQDSTGEYLETSRRYVKSNPEKGIAIAAVVGVVVGSLLTLSLTKRK